MEAFITIMTNIKIKAVDIYHAEKSISNEFYINHFKDQGKDISHFLEIMGRKDRFVIDNERENSLTMGIEASNRVLKKAGLTGKDLDMLVFTSQVPEYVIPTNALLVHHAIKGKENMVVYDMNANCAGMTIAVEQVSRYMMSNPHMKRALVVGSDNLSLLSSPEDTMTYSNFGDSSSAIILEKTEEDTGFIDSIVDVHSDTDNRTCVVYPEKGLSQTIKGNGQGKSMLWIPFDGRFVLPQVYKMFEKVLERNNLKIEDIDHFCLSQFALTLLQEIQDHYHIPEEKIIFSGDRYGYTGTSSPFMAFHEGIDSGKIKRGDKVLFWTIGGGYQLATMLFKY